MEACRFENISQAIVELDRVKDGNQQVNILNSAFAEVSTLIVPRGGAPLMAPKHPLFHADHIAYGVQLDLSSETKEARGVTQNIRGERELKALPDLPARDIPDLPSLKQWRDVKTLGVMGDGKTDDTAALQKAVGQAGVFYFPPGRYLVSDTIHLHPEARLIGLHPRSTLLQVPHQHPNFANPQKPKALLHAPLGGSNYVSGIGFDPGLNPGGYSIHWQAGAKSYLGDFWVSWAHTEKEKATSQSGVIWVEGGGGVFKNIWSGHKNPPTSLRVSDTDIPGRMYQLSLEHKIGREIIIERVKNWSFYNLQTEHSQSMSETEESIPITISDSSHLIFANTYLYRTSGTKRIPRDGIVAEKVSNLKFYGIHNFNWKGMPSRFSYEDAKAGIQVETKELTTLFISGE